MSTTILITGFGPFPGEPQNASGDVARHVDGAHLWGARLVGRTLETSWAHAWPQLAAAVADVQPTALVMLGVAPRRLPQVERHAQNRTRQRLDCHGALPAGPDLEPGAPAVLDTTLPWQALSAAGVDTSEDAGRYLCNAVFFRALYNLPHVRWRGFVHIPRGDWFGGVRVVGQVVRALKDAAESARGATS